MHSRILIPFELRSTEQNFTDYTLFQYCIICINSLFSALFSSTAQIYQYSIHVTAYVSVYTLVLMSLDRYLAVVHPIRSMTLRSQRNVCLAIGAACVAICTGNAPILLEFVVIPYPYGAETRSVCALDGIMENVERGRVFYGCFFAFGYAVPLSLVCVLYGSMIRRLLKGNAATGGGGGGGDGATSAASRAAGKSVGQSRSAAAEHSRRSKRRVTRMVIVTTVTFAACWLPFQVLLLLQFFGATVGDDESNFFIVLKIVANCLAYTNSCVNPILYAFLSEPFRKSFRRLLCCRDGKKKKPVTTTAAAAAAAVAKGSPSVPAAATPHNGARLLATMKATGSGVFGDGGSPAIQFFDEQRHELIEDRSHRSDSSSAQMQLTAVTQV